MVEGLAPAKYNSFPQDIMKKKIKHTGIDKPIVSFHVKVGISTGIRNVRLTSNADTLFLVPGVPCFELACFATIEHLFTSCAWRQAYTNRATTLVAVLQQWLPVECKYQKYL